MMWPLMKTSTDELFAHLDDKAKAMLELSDVERIQAIRAGSWIPLKSAKDTLAKMEELLTYPAVTRMPNLLLVGPSFSGKTSILDRFMSLHPPDFDPTAEVTIYPVVKIDAPPKPDISDFYSRILDALMSQYKPTAPAHQKYSQIKVLFRQMQVKVLIIDEIHHLIAGSSNRQREFRNALKSLGNETRICVVAAGIEEAYNAFNSDSQMSSRFVPIHLPNWRADSELGKLLATMERRMPLRRPSDLKSVEMVMDIAQRSEGTLGDVFDLVKEAGVDAIRSGEECITKDGLTRLGWVPPSKRKQYRRSV